MTKFVESSKGTRLGSKYSHEEWKKQIKAHNKLLEEYEQLTVEVEEAWQEYMGHICVKCIFRGSKCPKRSELRSVYTALQAKQMRMELFSNVS